MTMLTNELPAELPTSDQPPCLSLYQSTHRHHPDNQQDPIRYRNLVKELKHSLEQKYSAREIKPLLEPLESLADEGEFWNHTQDGLAVLRAPGLLRIYKLQRPVQELAVAADSFHTKPLLRILQSVDRYQVLGLSRGAVKLFEGNRDALDEIDLEPEVPRTLKDALGDKLTESHQTVVAHGGGTMRFGQGGRKDETDIDAERYFRAIDRAVLDHHSRPSGLPLMLAALPEHHNLFRKSSRNPFLMNEAIDVHPDAVSMDELRERAWQAIEPRYLARLSQLTDEFGQAKPKGLADDRLPEIAMSASAGRVTTLLIEANREIPGHLDEATGRVEAAEISHPKVDDLLDDLGEVVLRRGGQVVVVPTERMPTETGAAAIYRY
ncbi:MAG: hypothetical protein WBF42_00010 [Terracidiphilus sp.]